MNTIHFSSRVYIAENSTKSEENLCPFRKRDDEAQRSKKSRWVCLVLLEEDLFHFPDGWGFDRRCGEERDFFCTVVYSSIIFPIS
jgi:hypothetical protein